MSVIPRTSRAAVLVDYNKPLEIREIEIRRLEPGAILVRVEAATLCGTDVHISHGKLTQFSKVPLVVGHEITGRIAKLGEGRAVPSGVVDGEIFSAVLHRCQPGRGLAVADIDSQR